MSFRHFQPHPPMSLPLLLAPFFSASTPFSFLPLVCGPPSLTRVTYLSVDAKLLELGGLAGAGLLEREGDPASLLPPALIAWLWSVDFVDDNATSQC